MLATGHEPILRDEAIGTFLDTSRAASDRLAQLVEDALDETPRTLLELCERVHAAYGGLPEERIADLALTVDGHLGRAGRGRASRGRVGDPRRFRSRA